jgi:peptidoglycan-N-acetylglucosamine deacetylase
VLIYYKHGDRDKNEISLTFDDGPILNHTMELLDILDKYKVKAAFFLLGKWAILYPDIVKEIIKKGHLVGNHGYAHSIISDDFKKAQQVLKKITGNDIKYLRPPHGSLHYPGLRKFQSIVKIVKWDVCPSDWKQPANDIILKRVIENTINGSIILLHDGNETVSESDRCVQMLKALPKIIEALKKQYIFVGLDQMKLVPSRLLV